MDEAKSDKDSKIVSRFHHLKVRPPILSNGTNLSNHVPSFCLQNTQSLLNAHDVFHINTGFVNLIKKHVTSFTIPAATPTPTTLIRTQENQPISNNVASDDLQQSTTQWETMLMPTEPEQRRLRKRLLSTQQDNNRGIRFITSQTHSHGQTQSGGRFTVSAQRSYSQRSTPVVEDDRDRDRGLKRVDSEGFRIPTPQHHRTPQTTPGNVSRCGSDGSDYVSEATLFAPSLLLDVMQHAGDATHSSPLAHTHTSQRRVNHTDPPSSAYASPCEDTHTRTRRQAELPCLDPAVMRETHTHTHVSRRSDSHLASGVLSGEDLYTTPVNHTPTQTHTVYRAELVPAKDRAVPPAPKRVQRDSGVERLSSSSHRRVGGLVLLSPMGTERLGGGNLIRPSSAQSSPVSLIPHHTQTTLDSCALAPASPYPVNSILSLPDMDHVSSPGVVIPPPQPTHTHIPNHSMQPSIHVDPRVHAANKSCLKKVLSVLLTSALPETHPLFLSVYTRCYQTVRHLSACLVAWVHVCDFDQLRSYAVPVVTTELNQLFPSLTDTELTHTLDMAVKRHHERQQRKLSHRMYGHSHDQNRTIRPITTQSHTSSPLQLSQVRPPTSKSDNRNQRPPAFQRR